MNGFPAEGMGTEAAVLLGYFGQAFNTDAPPVMCKLFGTIRTPGWVPVGIAGQSLSNIGGVSLVPTWKGVTVNAGLTVADEANGSIISIDKISATTNEHGYFEIMVVQGLNVAISCPSLGTIVHVDTTGLTSVDVSTLL